MKMRGCEYVNVKMRRSEDAKISRCEDDRRKFGSETSDNGQLKSRGEKSQSTPLWREAHFEVKMYKAHHSQSTFGSCDVEKVHAVVA